ncbi:MAG: hypothetical protein ACFFDP_06270 [Promethearchaeota archaeon]
MSKPFKAQQTRKRKYRWAGHFSTTITLNKEHNTQTHRETDSTKTTKQKHGAEPAYMFTKNWYAHKQWDG